MKENPSRAALLVIDMENGFVTPQGGHCPVNICTTRKMP